MWVPDERLKTLQAFGMITSGRSREEIRNRIIQEMGSELAKKLLEYGKVSLRKREIPYEDSVNVAYYASIQIIVPDGPQI